MTKMVKSLAPKALAFLLLITLLCGVIYPLFVTGISQLLFPKQANGSIIEINGTKYGSELLAQQFTGNQYMWGRVMNLDTKTFQSKDGKTLLYATPSNLSPASDEYKKLIAGRVAKIKAADPDKANTPIPEDLVTCSGSGLDPHISPAAADYQISRIAKARGISADKVHEIVLQYTNRKLFGIFGEDTVNVLQVNLALDGILK
ncbi:potassium-transporting ATPase subunit KdpC [Caproiciproducens galactitolivorans]|uniref:Potassium-transporting ATPase KdpC subunit n=1 Tax=Caproiciproducens galactitolivorans TaxID=642589 RepID=A0ABT4BQC2_9FIRM|nr:potassium-transporting ATPase subunit KdpC [Caproiciproducens galactitolivorans]MCY1713009.1 potassium-transporting ATPase subunit KdpC [Caproiciproducens galactitolivorans]